jgi:predicted AlkP superfamily phosphohydrolase/phosphomutase
LGGLYLNLKNREAEGIVGEADAGRLKSEIASRLTGMRDSRRGEVAVRTVVSREEVYSGPYLENAPDLLVGYARGYRVATSTAMGGVGAETVTDNVRAWSGDHVVDPVTVPGVLFMNTPFRGGGARLLDLAPTVLDALGVPGREGMEGKGLLP